MADINIEKKPKSVWPWIVGSILFVLAIILIFGDGWQQKMGDDSPVAGITNGNGVPQEIEDYIAFVRTTEPSREMEMDHDYTAEGIQKLAAALDALVNETDSDVNINDKKDRLKQTADYIQQDPYSTSHADSIKAAFTIASEIIASVQQQNFPGLSSETASVKSAAQNIDPGTQTLDQKEQVKDFFEESASALDAMAKHMNGNGNHNQ
jgi:hypothetical protein